MITKNKKIFLYDKYGNQENSFDIEISSAIYNSSDKYLIVAEKEGNKFYVIHNKNIVWQEEIDGKIQKIEINNDGYVVIKAYDTNYKSIIILYNAEGKELFKQYLSNTVVDISITEDSKYLAYAELNTSGILVQSDIKIISIEKVLKKEESSIVFEHKTDIDKLILNIKYQTDNKLVCMYDNSIDIIENNKNRELVNLENKNITYMSIELKDSVLIVEENANGDVVESEATIINTSNNKKYKYSYNQCIKKVYVANNVIALNYGTELHVIAKNGWLIKKYISKKEIDDIVISKGIVGIIEKSRLLTFDI